MITADELLRIQRVIGDCELRVVYNPNGLELVAVDNRTQLSFAYVWDIGYLTQIKDKNILWEDFIRRARNVFYR